MIIKCSKKDLSKLKSFLREELIFNTFILADIANYGFDEGFQQVYMEVSEQSECKFVYLVFYNNLILAGDPDCINIDFIKSIIAKSITVIMGKDSLISLLRASLNGSFKYIENSMWYLKDNRKLLPSSNDCKIATLNDVDKIHAFLMSFESLKNRYASKDMIYDRIDKNDGTHAYIEQNGAILAHGNSTARSDYSVMIGGLASRSQTSKSDLELFIVSYLSKIILESGRFPCLFSETDTVRDLGYTLLGKWSTLELLES